MKALLSLMLFVVVNAHANEAGQVFDRIRSSMVLVNIFDERNEAEGAGSGVVVDERRVITNCHVVREAAAVRVTWGENILPARVVLEDDERDLCQLDVPDLEAKPVKIRAVADVQVGETAFAIGNPLGLGLSVSNGIVSGVKEYQGQHMIFSSTPIAPGSSGGGLFDAEGRLIGVTSAMLSRGQNYNRSVPADDIAQLARRGKAPKMTPDPGPDPDWSGQAEMLRSSEQWGKLAEWSRQWGSAYPTSSVADRYLGLALINLNQPEHAQQILLNAVRLDPRDAFAHAYLGIAYQVQGEKEKANQALKKAMQLNPIAGYFPQLRAEWQMKAFEYEAMLESARDVTRLEPWNEYGWRYQAVALHELRRLDEAIQAYRTVLRLKPDDEFATSRLAALLAAGGASADAHNLLTGAAKNQASNAIAWVNIGVGEEKKKNIGEAERAYRKALELDPKLAKVWLRLGVVLNWSGRSQEGEKAIRKALELKPDFADAWIELSDVLRLRGAKAEQKEAMEKAFALAPSSTRAAYGIAILRQEKHDFEGMIAPLQTASLSDPTNAEVWALLGDAMVLTGRADEGYKALQKAQEIDPKNLVMLGAFARYYGTRGRYNDSLSFAEQALAINGADPASWSGKGYSLLKLGRFIEAAQALETAVRLQPDFVNAWINLGETYLRGKQLGKAIATLEKTLTMAPRAMDAQLYLVQSYAASSQYAKAQKRLDVLIAQSPNYPVAWYMLAGINLAQNNRQGALDAYAKLKRLDPKLAREMREKSRLRFPVITLPD